MLTSVVVFLGASFGISFGIFFAGGATFSAGAGAGVTAPQPPSQHSLWPKRCRKPPRKLNPLPQHVSVQVGAGAQHLGSLQAGCQSFGRPHSSQLR